METMRQRILVVDDDASLAEMLTIVLRGEGFDTAVIGDGTQALTAVRELRPDLVLLDLMLPGMNGIDVCRVLRADSGVPIVMLTAKTDTVDVVLGLESGADDYIMKPFKPKELVARVLAAGDEPGLPWHRVLRSDGRVAFPAGSQGFDEQVQRLRAEGVQVESGRVRGQLAAPTLDQLLWAPPEGPRPPRRR